MYRTREPTVPKLRDCYAQCVRKQSKTFELPNALIFLDFENEIIDIKAFFLESGRCLDYNFVSLFNITLNYSIIKPHETNCSFIPGDDSDTKFGIVCLPQQKSCTVIQHILRNPFTQHKYCSLRYM